MNFLTLTAYSALLMSAVALGKTVIGLLRQFNAERRLAAKVAADPMFREVSPRITEAVMTKKATARIDLESDPDFQAKMAAILEHDSSELSPQERIAVGFGLHQTSNIGRSSYVTKMALQSERQLTGVGSNS